MSYGVNNLYWSAPGLFLTVAALAFHWGRHARTSAEPGDGGSRTKGTYALALAAVLIVGFIVAFQIVFDWRTISLANFVPRR